MGDIGASWSQCWVLGFMCRCRPARDSGTGLGSCDFRLLLKMGAVFKNIFSLDRSLSGTRMGVSEQLMLIDEAHVINLELLK